MSHIAPISMKAATTLAAYRIVTCTTATAWTVKYPAAATERVIGVTADTINETTQSIPVIIGGIAKVYFNDSCASGKLVAADTSGRGVVHADTTAGSYVIGVLIGADVQTTGTVAEVLVQPHFKSIP